MIKMKKLLSMLLVLSVVMGYVPMPASAEEGLIQPVHDENCGYAEAVAGSLCTHVCSDACKTKPVTSCVHDHGEAGCEYTAAVAGAACGHTHDEACGYRPAQEPAACTCGAQPAHTESCAAVVTEGAECDCAAPVTHAADCGYREGAAETPCTHSHDEACGYAAEKPESWSCGHACTVESGCVSYVCSHVCPGDACGFVQAAEGRPCTCAGEAGNSQRVCDCGEKCTELSETCPVCREDISGCTGKEPEPQPVAVDFMAWLDPVIPVIFQTTADIDLHDYLVMAYGLEVPFTCQPASVAYGAYEDGDTFAITLTAGEGYTGSAAVTAEVYHVAQPEVTAYIPEHDTLVSMGSYNWTLTPGQTGTDFYNRIEEDFHNRLSTGDGYIFDPASREYYSPSYITKDASGPQNGVFWKDCKNQTFSEGTYYVYTFDHGINVNYVIMYKQTVHVKVGYTVGIQVSGAPSGYGGVTVGGNDAGSAQVVSPNGSITLTVKDVPGYQAKVTYGNAACSVSGENYTFTGVNQNFSFSVVYEADEFATVSFTQPEGAVISVNGSSASPVQVVAGWPYTLSVTADSGYKLTGITIDGTTQTLNALTYQKEMTAGANGTAHTISVATEVVNLPVRSSGVVRYTLNQDGASLLKAVFNAAYTGSDYSEDQLSLSFTDGKDVVVSLYYGTVWMRLTDENIWSYLSSSPSTNLFIENIAESVTVKIQVGSSTSTECTVYLYDSGISARGEIQKDYTGVPVQLTSGDFQWNLPAAYQSASANSYRYYDAQKTLLEGAPTAPGTYYTRVQSHVYYKNEGAIVGTVYYSWSDYIPFEIVPVEVQSISGISGDRIYDGQPVVLDYTVTTGGSAGARTWTFAAGVCENFPYAPVYSYKEAGDSEFVSGLPADPGTYTVRIQISDYHQDATVTISKLAAETITVTDPADGIYSGAEQKPAITVKSGDILLTEGIGYTVSYANNTNAGTATVTVTGISFDGTITKTFAIAPMPLTVRAKDAAKTYGDNDPAGWEWEIVSGNQPAAGDPLDIRVTREAGENVRDGGYALTPSQAEPANPNYAITFETGSFTIRKAPLTVTAEDKQITYGDDAPGYTVRFEGLRFADTEAVLENLRITAAYHRTEDGQHDVRQDGYAITPSGPAETDNYTVTYLPGTLTVVPKELTVTVTASKAYDGTADLDKEQDLYTAELRGVVAGEDVRLDDSAVTYTFADSAVGENIGLSFTGEFRLAGTGNLGNYTLTQPSGLTGGIVNNWDPTEYTVTAPNGDGWLNGDFTVTAKEGYQISVTNSADGTWQEALTFSQETDSGSVTFYLRNEATGAISLAKAETFRIDKTPATGRITIGELTGWEAVVNSISFNLFFRDMQTVTITGADSLSGVKSVEYYAAAAAMTLEEVKAVTHWSAYSGSLKVPVADAGRFVYFAKITDKAGNVTYLSTDGAVYDTAAPVISIASGVFYTTQTVTVTDANPDTLTVNGQSVASPFTLEGNQNTTYTIVATDKAGNQATVTVTMKTIAALEEPMGDLNADKVTSAHRETIQEVLDNVNELLKDETLPQAEKDALEDIREEAENLLDTLDAAAGALDTEAVRKVEGIHAANVKPENREDLEKAQEDLEDAKERHWANYSPEEKAALNADIQRISDALAAIRRVEAFNTAMKNPLLKGEVKTDMDAATEQAIRDAQAAYSALSPYEKTLIPTADKARLEALTATITDYKITRGSGGRHTIGSGRTLSFTANGPVRKFDYVQINGKILAASNYTVTEGSTVITLKSSYLDKLGSGRHKIRIVYTDGATATVNFRIYTSGGNPFTGDDSQLLLLGGIMAASLLCIGLLVMFAPRRKGKFRR